MAETTANKRSSQDRRIAPNGVGLAAYTTIPGDLGIAAFESGNAAFHQTRIELNGVAQTITNGASEYTNTLLYTFPIGRIAAFGCVAALAPTTTSTLSSTITSGTSGAFSVGSVVASNASLTSTMVDWLPSTAYTSSTTIAVAAATVAAALAATPTVQFDGTSTAAKLYLNNSIATNSADGTMTWAGFVTISWLYLGDT